METVRVSNDTAKLHQLLGSKLYADKYSFISEICQNAVDSHRMAGIKEPVIVGIGSRVSPGPAHVEHFFYVKDVGLSFDSKEDFTHKVLTILESGKSAEKTNDENCAMGMHGIGSISVSKFYPGCRWKYEIVKDGRKFTCYIQEVEGKGIQYEMSDYEETDEPKGVYFEVPLPTGVNYQQTPNVHISPLVEGMKRKLCYFKDIFFEFSEPVMAIDKKLLTLNSQFQLYQSEDFQISTLNSVAEMHISMDQYSYMIRWNDLGIPAIIMPVALKFGMGDGLEADITRENLNFDEKYKPIIMEKIEKVANWMVKTYNDSVPDEHTSLAEYYKALESDRFIKINGWLYNMGVIQKYASIPVKKSKFKGVSTEVLQCFAQRTSRGSALTEFRYEISRGGSKIKKNSYNRFYGPDSLKYFVSKDIPASTLEYLKAHKKGAGLFYMPRIPLKQKNKANDVYYINLLGLHSTRRLMKATYIQTGVNLWREKIKEFQILEQAFIDDNFTRIEDIKIPDSFTQKTRKSPTRKKKVDLDSLSGEIGIGYSEDLAVGSLDWNCKFVDKTVEIRDLYKTPKFHIYGTAGQRKLLDRAYLLCSTGKDTTTRPCIISERNQKYIKKLNLHNFMDVEEFFKGKSGIFKKVMTSYLIEKELIVTHKDIVANRDHIRKYLSTTFADDLQEMQNYCSRYNSGRYLYKEGTDEFMKELEAMTHAGKMYDLEVWEKFQMMKKEIVKFDFVPFFTPYLSIRGTHVNDKAIKALLDLAKYRSIKMDWGHYKITENIEAENNGSTDNVNASW